MDCFQARLSLILQFPGSEFITAALRLFNEAAWRRVPDVAEIAPLCERLRCHDSLRSFSRTRAHVDVLITALLRLRGRRERLDQGEVGNDSQTQEGSQHTHKAPQHNLHMITLTLCQPLPLPLPRFIPPSTSQRNPSDPSPVLY